MAVSVSALVKQRMSFVGRDSLVQFSPSNLLGDSLINLFIRPSSRLFLGPRLIFYSANTNCRGSGTGPADEDVGTSVTDEDDDGGGNCATDEGRGPADEDVGTSITDENDDSGGNCPSDEGKGGGTGPTEFKSVHFHDAKNKQHFLFR
ncbi:hypothetical protein RRG08_051556 [Elysia crispata]|uniref:Uncharacterized protein n=1 Tax=Elysia crispata TaxID=231223 RepID=A0AAE1CQT2_9GAST|nr:hypothetical protein RRG08_051556 [Elysia crispata]